ncbi:hypothetical protein E2C01_080649 [Portunus trituberculatus]|uniref:Uncharacterized protein n=1 Tax=Portunus trituberculatus TaxID=210409 RepID=A0A5B7IK78_PORTR|nr:hypothetical protein [Portunus trituberculatus]
MITFDLRNLSLLCLKYDKGGIDEQQGATQGYCRATMGVCKAATSHSSPGREADEVVVMMARLLLVTAKFTDCGKETLRQDEGS